MVNYTIESFRAIYEAWKESGRTVRDYCFSNSINESRFYYWKKKVERPSRPSAQAGCFLPVAVSRNGGMIEMQPWPKGRQHAQNGPSCRIVYPNGVSLAIDGSLPLDLLRTLITLQG
ncbi:MAG: IS66 family insertion sequence element accessory protein TnpB [Eggerthellaceae bacterium]|nr:IS66 family insertion sequence element accessory protein TnpB [Eggerthellaceae bacterium]